MTFTSPSFAPFLLGVVVLAALIGRRRRWIVLLAASVASYASFGAPYLVVVLGAVAAASFGCALAMERTADPARRKRLLWIGLAVVLGALGVLKYLGFLGEGINAVGAFLGLRPTLPTGQIFLSIGVSYYSLQAIGYLLDVHDEATPAERHFGHFALYLSFFPKMVQGPIERSEKLLPQLRDAPAIAGDDLSLGLQRMLWGLFQKVVVADSLAPFVGAVYGNARSHHGLPLVVATYLFAAQLYFDFAGYTDIALGVARLFGIRLSPNFRSPYLATSIADFWRRWHISFSSWLLDYVFRPLQAGLRDWRKWGTPAALLVTFLVSGIWHGATWGFVLWGMMHGTYLASSLLFRPIRARVLGALRLEGSRVLGPVEILVTFHLVCFSWIFFRADSVGDAVWIASRGLTGLPDTAWSAVHGQSLESLVYLGQGRGRFLFVIAMIAAGTVLRSYFRALGVTEEVARPAASERAWTSPWGRAVVYALMVYAIAFYGTATQGFMYEQY